MGEKRSALTVSSCTSLPVATPSRPIWPAAFSTEIKPDGLLEGQRTRGHLRADEQREGARLRRVERHAQLARVGIEAPQGDEGGGGVLCRSFRRRRPVRANDVGDGGAGGTSSTNSLSSPCAGRIET